MAEKRVAHTVDGLKPPFARRPIPPPAPTTTSPQASSSSRASSVDHQPGLETSVDLPLTDLDSLPTIIGKGGKGHKVVLANTAIEQFLNETLCLKRLNRIHGLLWMAGRPMRARPIHRYKMMSFNILCTQQMDLHLLKFSDNLLLRPLPEWILSYDFWNRHICPHPSLHRSACGFLLSYVWLITTPLDLIFAHQHHLLPGFITWHWWKSFVADFYQHVDINTLHQVNPRYRFGELRLNRINTIYRIRYFSTHFVRGYLYGFNRYAVYFQRNFSWLLSLFVLFSLVLSAMQVGVSLSVLQRNSVFLRGSYGFVVLSMVCVASVLAILTMVFAFVFLFNMVAAIDHVRRERRERQRLKAELRSTKDHSADSC